MGGEKRERGDERGRRLALQEIEIRGRHFYWWEGRDWEWVGLVGQASRLQ